MKMNTLEMEWTEDNCVARATGFEGVLLTCPRCRELLPRDTEHRCGIFPLVIVPKKIRHRIRKGV